MWWLFWRFNVSRGSLENRFNTYVKKLCLGLVLFSTSWALQNPSRILLECGTYPKILNCFLTEYTAAAGKSCKDMCWTLATYIMCCNACWDLVTKEKQEIVIIQSHRNYILMLPEIFSLEIMMKAFRFQKYTE